MSDKRNVLIVGAGVAGRLLAKSIQKVGVPHTAVGFVDDTLRTKDVLGTIDEMNEISKAYNVDEIALAIPTAPGELVRRVLDVNMRNRIPIRCVPREQYVLQKNAVSYEDLRELTADDILGRPLTKRNIARLEVFYRNKTIFITGGAGSIGSEIVRQALELGARKVVVYDNSEYLVYMLKQNLHEAKVPQRKYRIVMGSVLDFDKVQRTISRVQPDIVFHAAAYKHVHLMEENADEAILTNVVGTKYVLQASFAVGVHQFVLISTDKVVNPKSVMGATKKLAEQYVLSQKTKSTICSIVRFGNVINSHGSVLPLFKRQIREHRYVTITDRRMERFFMSIREAARLVLTSATRRRQKSVYVLDMGDLINIEHVARYIIRSHGLVPGIDVAIREVGRRPGEKLKEELFSLQEQGGLIQTKLPYVLRVREVEQYVAAEILGATSRLEGIARRGGSSVYIKRELGSLFPSLLK